MKPSQRVPLWTGCAPSSLGQQPVRDIPTITPYWPDPSTATGASIILCPGGGYWELMDYEGRDYALWLNKHGIAAFVLTYRLACHGYHYPATTNDVTRAIRYVRYFSQQWGLDANRIGVMGSSAGGHLASFAATHHEEQKTGPIDPIDCVSSRPDLAVLCYAVTSMVLWPMDNLLGPNPTPELIRHLSSELNVSSSTPPCFIWQTQDDPVVSVEHALLFSEALRRKGVGFSLHIYPSGPHGIGLGVHGYDPEIHEDLHPWTDECYSRLGFHGFISRKKLNPNQTLMPERMSLP
ncbi:MAG: alpha/beta hydrolase [Verrucomicrobiota bacterium]